jgi:hypothetical protein
LILEGFSSIKITLVDLGINDKILAQLQKFFKKTFSEVTISWSWVQTVSKIHPQAQFDLIYAIDFMIV